MFVQSVRIELGNILSYILIFFIDFYLTCYLRELYVNVLELILFLSYSFLAATEKEILFREGSYCYLFYVILCTLFLFSMILSLFIRIMSLFEEENYFGRLDLYVFIYDKIRLVFNSIDFLWNLSAIAYFFKVLNLFTTV